MPGFLVPKISRQANPIMTSPNVVALRSVAIDVPDPAAAEDFFTRVWRLSVAERSGDAVFLRGSGTAHHLLSLHRGQKTALRNVTFQVHSPDALRAIAAAAPDAGGRVLAATAALTEPGGGSGLTISDADGRVFRFVHGDALHLSQADPDAPVRLAHVVLNGRDVAKCQRFCEEVMGFRLSDRTRIMAFMRCNRDHHSIAFADANQDSVNHIAFQMPDLDAVMRGGGRLKDAGYPIEWGPGRHGPGNNAFNYFVGPFDLVIEYTAEVQQVDDSYRTGRPEDWKWPPGRVDQWGISQLPSARLKQAQTAIFFKAT
jgi:catechol 2,3-dioxygenase-like lactoylglutathione lyase family enzyme